MRLRAERTGALHDELYLAAETDLATILGHVDEVRPELLIVDSVQTVSSSLSEGMAGHPSQVREVASTLIRVAKDRGLPVIIVGHVTKDGSIAGPRILEHLVDVVCQFEGDRQTSLRFVRALKNRFGPTDEVGCFDMTGDGHRRGRRPERAVPRARQRPSPAPASRSRSRGAARCRSRCRRSRSRRRRRNPRRIVNGVDAARVAMVLAVLEKTRGHQTLATSTSTSRRSAACASPSRPPTSRSRSPSPGRCADEATPQRLAAVGELSLAGEVRPVTQTAQRRSPRPRGSATPRWISTIAPGRLRAALDDVRCARTVDDGYGPTSERRRPLPHARIARDSGVERVDQLVGSRLHRVRTGDVEEDRGDRACAPRNARSHAGDCRADAGRQVRRLVLASLNRSSAISPVFGSR